MKAKQTITTTGVAVGLLAIIGGLLVPDMFFRSASAEEVPLSYQDSVDVQFTFTPSLNVALSSEAVSIANLIPGNAGSSVVDGNSALTITTTTNNVDGYTLQATVGGTGEGEFDTTSLMNGTASLSSIPYKSSDYITALPTTSGVWGYSIDKGASFNGFADTSTAVTLKTTSAPTGTVAGDTTATFDIGAYAPQGQTAGEYTNVVKFTSVVNVATP
ncbi:hypothetical protein IJ118_02145 [Candidatus Saccharibacteria bacterium]|nr:hypothetical protein [Candidatus Saccharibacteria bacterium]